MQSSSDQLTQEAGLDPSVREKKKYSCVSTCCSKEVVWLWGERPDLCPFCGTKYWDKPNHEFILFHLQDEFIADYEKTGSTKILGEKMFPVMVEYAENIIKGFVKGKTFIPWETLHERANDAATRVIETIYRSPDMRMHFSFGDMLSRWCKNGSFSNATINADQTYSLQHIIGDGDKEFGDMVSKRVQTGKDEDNDPVFSELTFSNVIEMKAGMDYSLSKEVTRIIRKTVDIIRDDTQDCKTTLLYLLGLVNRVSGKNEKQMNGYYEAVGNGVRLYVEKGELVMFEYLKELAHGS